LSVLLQLGSQTLGRVIEEDAEKGLVFWDVFKSVRLENLKARQLDEGGWCSALACTFALLAEATGACGLTAPRLQLALPGVVCLLVLHIRASLAAPYRLKACLISALLTVYTSLITRPAWLTEELKPKNAKRMRVQHTINIASKMPRSFNTHTPMEGKVLAYVQVRCGDAHLPALLSLRKSVWSLAPGCCCLSIRLALNASTCCTDLHLSRVGLPAHL
jgi:hypothetical protein